MSYTKEQILSIIKEEVTFNSHIEQVWLSEDGLNFTWNENSKNYKTSFSREEILNPEQTKKEVKTTTKNK
jgi:hypothetical protein